MIRLVANPVDEVLHAVASLALIHDLLNGVFFHAIYSNNRARHRIFTCWEKVTIVLVESLEQ